MAHANQKYLLEFKVMLIDSDWLHLRNNDLDDIIWTHLEAIKWLDDLDYPCEYTELLVDQWAEWHITRKYLIDEHTLDFLFLKWPDLLKSRSSYETIQIGQILCE